MLAHGLDFTPQTDPVTGEDMSWKHTEAWMRSAQIQQRLNARNN